MSTMTVAETTVSPSAQAEPPRPDTPPPAFALPVLSPFRPGFIRNGVTGFQDLNGVWYNIASPGVAVSPSAGVFPSAASDHRSLSRFVQDSCLPLPFLAETVLDHQGSKEDEWRPSSECRLTQDLRWSHNDRPLTWHTLSQLCRLSKVPPDFLKMLIDRGHPKLAAVNLMACLGDRARHVAGAANEDLFLRYREGTTRAALSHRYGVLDNARAIEVIMNALPPDQVPDTLGKSLWTDEDDMVGMLFPPDSWMDESEERWAVGLTFGNSEIGNRSFYVRPYLYRAFFHEGQFFEGGLLWDHASCPGCYSRVHMGNIDTGTTGETLRLTLAAVRAAGAQLLVQLRQSRDVLVPNVPALITALCRENRLTGQTGRAWYACYMRRPVPSGYGVITALMTLAGGHSGETRSEFEALAARLLTPELESGPEQQRRRWAQYVTRAQSLALNEPELVSQYTDGPSAAPPV